jgi:hypothetical protein
MVVGNIIFLSVRENKEKENVDYVMAGHNIRFL